MLCLQVFLWPSGCRTRMPRAYCSTKPSPCAAPQNTSPLRSVPSHPPCQPHIVVLSYELELFLASHISIYELFLLASHTLILFINFFKMEVRIKPVSFTLYMITLCNDLRWCWFTATVWPSMPGLWASSRANCSRAPLRSRVQGKSPASCR